MQNSLAPLNSPKKTLHPVRAAVWLALRTALWTALILASGLYCANEGILPQRGKPPAGKEIIHKPAPIPARQKSSRLPAAGAVRTAATDPLALIKPGKPLPGLERKAASRRAPAAIPRMRPATFGSSGGGFAPLLADYAENRASAPSPAATDRKAREEEGVFLGQAALSKKVRLKGARPVSAAAEKRYTGTDREAGELRAVILSRAEAAEAERKRLRRGRLILAGWIVLAALAIMLIASRVVKAWRLLEKPEGKHWTLK